MLTSAAATPNDDLSPAQLVLDLLDAEPVVMGITRRLLAAGRVFGFSDNQMRVAISRLVADGLLRNPRRGHYHLSGDGAAMREEIQRWRHIEHQLKPWNGDWCAVLTGNLANEGSTRFRHQSRALELRGLRRWRPGLWVRPDNLTGTLPQLTRDLAGLGFDAVQGSFLIHRPDADTRAELHQLWDSAAINREYQRHLDNLEGATARLQREGATPAILGETLKLGGRVIRFLLKDPLLPEDLVNTASRRALIDAMERYDQLGRQRWQQFINDMEGSP